MKQLSGLVAVFFVIAILIAMVFVVSACQRNREIQNINKSESRGIKNMEIRSPVFENGGSIPRKYTCQGENISPPLEFLKVPGNAKSLVLIVDDPDAVKPAGRVWDHWVLFNIPVETKGIAEGGSAGSAGRNTGGENRYTGPCPPDGEHRYFFKLYALDTLLDLKEGATKKEVEEAMEGHVIEKAEIVGKYVKS